MGFSGTLSRTKRTQCGGITQAQRAQHNFSTGPEWKLNIMRKSGVTGLLLLHKLHICLVVMSDHTLLLLFSLAEQVNEEKWLVEQRRLENKNNPFQKLVDHKTRFTASLGMSSSGVEGWWGGGTSTKKQQTCGRQNSRSTLWQQALISV